MTQGGHISQEDLALHAMQALSREESALVRVHLEDCAECRAALAEITGDLALVAMSVEQHPVPEGARQRFMERLATTGPLQGGDREETLVSPVVSIDSARRARRFAILTPWLVAAAMLLVAIGLEMRVRDLHDRLDQQSARETQQAAASARAQDVLDVLTAPAAQHVVLTAAKERPAPTARAVYLASRGALILQASNLAPLPADKAYELWVIPTSGAPVPAGLFRPDAAGSASLVLPQISKGIPAKAFGITIEKASGSDTPTAPIVLSGAAPAAGE